MVVTCNDRFKDPSVKYLDKECIEILKDQNISISMDNNIILRKAYLEYDKYNLIKIIINHRNFMLTDGVYDVIKEAVKTKDAKIYKLLLSIRDINVSFKDNYLFDKDMILDDNDFITYLLNHKSLEKVKLILYKIIIKALDNKQHDIAKEIFSRDDALSDKNRKTISEKYKEFYESYVKNETNKQLHNELSPNGVKPNTPEF